MEVCSSLAVNVAIPFALAQILLHRGAPAIEAFSLAAIAPAASTIVGLVRSRRVDPLSVLALIAIVVGITTARLSGSAAILIAKDAC